MSMLHRIVQAASPLVRSPTDRFPLGDEMPWLEMEWDKILRLRNALVGMINTNEDPEIDAVLHECVLITTLLLSDVRMEAIKAKKGLGKVREVFNREQTRLTHEMGTQLGKLRDLGFSNRAIAVLEHQIP